MVQRVDLPVPTLLGNLSDPQRAQDAATRNYVDTSAGVYTLQPGAPTTNLSTVAVANVAVGNTDCRVLGDVTALAFQGTPIIFGTDTQVYILSANPNFDGATSRLQFTPPLTVSSGQQNIGTQVKYGAGQDLRLNTLVIGDNLNAVPQASGVVRLNATGGGGSGTTPLVNLGTVYVADNSAICIRISTQAPNLTVNGSIGSSVGDYSAVNITSSWPPTIPVANNQSFVFFADPTNLVYAGAGFVNATPPGITNISWIKRPPTAGASFTGALVWWANNSVAGSFAGLSVADAVANPSTTVVMPEGTFSNLAVGSDTFGGTARQVNFQPFIDGRIATQIGAIPVPPNLVFTDSSAQLNSYNNTTRVFNITSSQVPQMAAALLSVAGPGSSRNPNGTWVTPNTIYISLQGTPNPSSTQFSTIQSITEIASGPLMQINIASTNLAYFAAGTYPANAFFAPSRFAFATPPQQEVIRLAQVNTVASLNTLKGDVVLTSSDSSVAITTSGQNINLRAISGGGAEAGSYEQLVRVTATPTNITTWGGVDNGQPYAYVACPTTDYVGGLINGTQYFQPAAYVNPIGQPLTLPVQIGGTGGVPYSSFVVKMLMPSLNNVSLTFDSVPPSTGWVLNTWFIRIEAINQADTGQSRANIFPFQQAPSGDGANNFPIQSPVFSTPTITGNTITWPTITSGFWITNVPIAGYTPSGGGTSQAYIPIIYLTHNTYNVNTVSAFTVGSISNDGYYEMDLTLGVPPPSQNENLQQAVNLGNQITNAGTNIGTIVATDTTVSPNRTSSFAGAGVTSQNFLLNGSTSGTITLSAPAAVATYGLVLPGSQSSNNSNVLYVNSSGQGSYALPSLALQSFSAFTAVTTVAASAAIGDTQIVAAGNVTATIAAGQTISLVSAGANRTTVASSVFNNPNTTLTLIAPLTVALAVNNSIYVPTTDTNTRITTLNLSANMIAQVNGSVLSIASTGGGGGSGTGLQGVLNISNSATTVGAGNVASFTLTDGTFTTTVNPTQVASQRLVAQNGAITTTIRANSSLTTAYGLFLPVAQSNNALNTIYTDTNGVMTFGLPAIGNVIFSGFNSTAFSTLNSQVIGDESIVVSGNATSAIAAGDTISFLSGGTPRYTVEQVTFSSPNTTILLFTGLVGSVSAGATIYKGTADSSTQRVNALNVGAGLEYALVGGVLTLINSATGGLGSIPTLDQVTAQGANSTRAITVQAAGFNGISLGIPPTLSAGPVISSVGAGANVSIALAAKGITSPVLLGTTDLSTTSLSHTFSSTGVTLDALAGSGGGTPVFNFNKQVNITDGTATAGLQLTGGALRGIRTTGGGVIALGNDNSTLQFSFTSLGSTITALGTPANLDITANPKGSGNFNIQNTNNTLSVQLGAAGVTIIPTGPNVGANLTLSGQGAGANVIVGNTSLATGITVVGNSSTVSTIQATGTGANLDLTLLAKGSNNVNIGNGNNQITLTPILGALTLAPNASVGGPNVTLNLNAKGTSAIGMANASNGMVITPSATNVVFSSVNNNTNFVFSYQGLGSFYPIGQTISGTTNPRIFLPSSPGSTTLSSGNAGDIMVSNGSALAPSWSTPATGARFGQTGGVSISANQAVVQGVDTTINWNQGTGTIPAGFSYSAGVLTNTSGGTRVVAISATMNITSAPANLSEQDLYIVQNTNTRLAQAVSTTSFTTASTNVPPLNVSTIAVMANNDTIQVRYWANQSVQIAAANVSFGWTGARMNFAVIA